MICRWVLSAYPHHDTLPVCNATRKWTDDAFASNSAEEPKKMPQGESGPSLSSPSRPASVTAPDPTVSHAPTAPMPSGSRRRITVGAGVRRPTCDSIPRVIEAPWIDNPQAESLRSKCASRCSLAFHFSFIQKKARKRKSSPGHHEWSRMSNDVDRMVYIYSMRIPTEKKRIG